MNPDADRRVRSALAERICADPDVVFAVAFGSQHSDSATQASDFDVAVKFADDLSKRERFEKRCVLSGDIQGEDRPFVDVSDIEALPLDVAHDAVNGGFLCGDEGAFGAFKTNVETAFSEQRDTLRRHQRAVIDRIAEDGLRG